MNKRDAINHIRQFGGRLDRFRKSVGGSGDGGRNAPKRAKSSPKPVNRKTNVFNEQVRYAFHGALQDLKSKPFATFLTVMVIAISLTLPSAGYAGRKPASGSGGGDPETRFSGDGVTEYAA